MSQPDPASERLTRVLGTPELSWLVERIRGRIARGVPLDGVVTLTGATAQQRQAAARLLGRPPGRGSSLSVPLPAIEAALWASGLADGLRGAVEALGGTVTDLAAERTSFASRRDAALDEAQACKHAGQEWYAAWLAELSADGTLTRLLRAGRNAVLAQAAAILDLLPAAELPLPVLAERATGDTKALSAPPLPGLVLRALARWHGTEVPQSQAARRELWDAFGVIMDDPGPRPASQRQPARSLAHRGRRAGHAVPGDLAPAVIDAGRAGCAGRLRLRESGGPARRGGRTRRPPRAPDLHRRHPVGRMPSPARERRRRAWRVAGWRAVLCWRGDFDWTGLRTTAAAIATPWRMSAADYAAGLAGGDSEPLKGTPAGSTWDPGLADRMQSAGRAVMEERLIPELLSDLEGPGG